MQRCPECHRDFEVHDTATHGVCRFCGAEWNAETDTQQWASVARLKNVAEAGFLVNLLAEDDVAAQLCQYDDFSALDGCWNSVFVLRVPRKDAQLASRRISEIMSVSEEEEVESARLVEVSAAPIPWRPIALTVLVGSVAFLIGQASSKDSQTPPRASAQDALWDTVSQINAPFTTPRTPGKPAHRLWFDATSGKYHLETDADGDGRFELGKEFHRHNWNRRAG